MKKPRRLQMIHLAAILFCFCLIIPSVADASSAIIVGDSAMVPMRAVFEWLNATITYSGGRITAVRGTDTISLTVGSKQASVNGRSVTLGQAPVLRDGTTYVPLRFVAESMGAVVNYDPAAGNVSVTDGDRSLSIPISGHAPSDVAIRIFRQYMKEGPPARSYGLRNCVCFEKSKYPWLVEKGIPWMTDDAFGQKDTEIWPFTDHRFRQLLKQKGWKKGDLWFPYTIHRQSETKMSVEFHHRWWGASVDLLMVKGRWTPTVLEAWDEGDDDVNTWRVVPRGSGFRLVQEQSASPTRNGGR